MKILVVLLLGVLLFLFHAPARAYYKWYDEHGIAHFTEAPPPKNARDENGTSWWKKEHDEEPEYQVEAPEPTQKSTLKSNRNSHGLKRDTNSSREFEENIPRYDDEKESEQDLEYDEKKGLMSRIIGIFSRKSENGESQNEENENEQNEEEELQCEETWLIEKHGLCALNKPDMNDIGNTFKAEVVDHRKGVWSSCRGTVNGDVLTFKYKGNRYWETDGNVPQCAFYQGFYWK